MTSSSVIQMPSISLPGNTLLFSLSSMNCRLTKGVHISLLQHYQNYLCFHSWNNYMYLAMTVHKSNCSNKKTLLILILYLVRLILRAREVYFIKPHTPKSLTCTILAFNLQKNSSRCIIGKASPMLLLPWQISMILNTDK